MTKQQKIAKLKKQINKLYKGELIPMPKRKKKIRKGNFIARVQRSASVRSVRAKIRKHKAAGKRLSAQYKKALKTAARKLR